MKRHVTCRAGQGVLWVAMAAAVGLESCAVGLAPRSDAPFFPSNPGAAPFYQAVAREQEARLAICAKSQSCERAHYARALAALYESRESAARHFQQVAAAPPHSPVGAASRFWLQMLRDTPDSGRDDPYAQAVEQLVRDYLELELVSAQSLQREVKARDKKIEELTRQLEALKRIDREMKQKVRSKQPSGRHQP
jgi:hypothetical protein